MAERGGVVKVIIKARDLASSVVGRFRRNLASISRTARDVTRAVVMWTVAMAAAVIGLEKLAERGSKVLAVKRTFAKLTGDEVKGLNELSTAAKGTIADFTLMSLHNQALALGSAKTTEKFAEQIRITRILARAQGLTATEGLEKFTVGMARLSRLRLDDLGITLKQEEANDRYGASIGKSGDALDEEEKKIAFRTEAMRQALLLVEQLSTGEDAGAEAADRFGVAIKNLGDRFATLAAQSPMVAAFFDSLTSITSDLIDVVGGDTDTLVQGMKAIGRIMGDALSVGVNEGLAAASFLGPLSSIAERSARVARENLEANLVALGSIARAAEAQAAARALRESPRGQEMLNDQRREELALLERRQEILQEAIQQSPEIAANRAMLAATERRVEDLRAEIANADRTIAAARAAMSGGKKDEETKPGFLIGAGLEGTNAQLSELLDRLRSTRTELRAAEFEAFLAPTEEAAKKATEEVTKLGVALAGLEALADRFGGESLLGTMFAPIPGAPDPTQVGRGFGQLPSQTEFQREQARKQRLLPFGDRLSLSPGGRRQFLKGLGEDDRLKEAGERMKAAQAVTVSAMFGMAEAAVAGSGQVASSVIGMITQILQSATGGGVLGAFIGGFGGLLSATLRGNDPVPVKVDDYGSSALSKMREVGRGPLRITTIIEQGGVEIERIEREFLDRQARDENIRFGATIGMGS